MTEVRYSSIINLHLNLRSAAKRQHKHNTTFGLNQENLFEEKQSNGKKKTLTTATATDRTYKQRANFDFLGKFG